MAMKLPFLPSVRPMGKRRAAKQNFTSAALPRYLNSEIPTFQTVQTVLMTRTSS